MAYIPRSELTPEELAAKRAADHVRYERRKAGIVGVRGRPRKVDTVIRTASAQRKSTKWHKDNALMAAGVERGEDTIPIWIKPYYTDLRKAAFRRGIPFELTQEQVELLMYRSKGKCSLSDTPIVFARNFPNVASIDRIDSGGGYTIDNVQVVSSIVNTMKMELTMDVFKEMCTAIAMKHD